MPKFFESDADGYGLLAVIEKGTEFCFSRGVHDVAENVARRMDRTIDIRLGSRRFFGVD